MSLVVTPTPKSPTSLVSVGLTDAEALDPTATLFLSDGDSYDIAIEDITIDPDDLWGGSVEIPADAPTGVPLTFSLRDPDTNSVESTPFTLTPTAPIVETWVAVIVAPVSDYTGASGGSMDSGSVSLYNATLGGHGILMQSGQRRCRLDSRGVQIGTLPDVDESNCFSFAYDPTTDQFLAVISDHSYHRAEWFTTSGRLDAVEDTLSSGYGAYKDMTKFAVACSDPAKIHLWYGTDKWYPGFVLEPGDGDARTPDAVWDIPTGAHSSAGLTAFRGGWLIALQDRIGCLLQANYDFTQTSVIALSGVTKPLWGICLTDDGNILVTAGTLAGQGDLMLVTPSADQSSTLIPGTVLSLVRPTVAGHDNQTL